MDILETKGIDSNFYSLCKRLEEFQFSLMPELKDKGYNLTYDLNDINGYLLYINNEPVGCIGLKKCTDDVCEIVRVFICKEHREKGYSKLLFSKIETLARTLGFKTAIMFAWVKAEVAINLYKKLGYIIIEEKVSNYSQLVYFKLSKKL